MFGNLLGNFKEKQEALKEKLATIEVTASAGGGAVKVIANCARQIVSISIDKAVLAEGDPELVEDMVMEAVNAALELAAKKEKEEAEKLIQEMMPPGLGGLGNLFG